MEIDDKIMRYRSNYKNLEIEGEMSREEVKKMKRLFNSLT